MAENSSSVLKDRIWFGLFFVALIGLQVLLTMHLRMSWTPAPETEEETAQAYNPELFKVLSFGQLPAVVDWMWIKTLEDPRISHVKPGKHPTIYYTLDLITDLDPAFMSAYTAGATLVSVIRNDGPGALHLALKGEKFRKFDLPHYPEEFKELYWEPEWQLPLLLAYIYLFDMEDIRDSANAFREASEIPGSPAYLKMLIRKFDAPDGLYVVGTHVLTHMIEGTKDLQVKARLIQKRNWLEVNFYLKQMNEKFATYQKTHRTAGKGRNRVWIDFLRSVGETDRDPWGGKISLDDHGKIVTTTSHQKVLGLE